MSVTSTGLAINLKCSTIRAAVKRVLFVPDRLSAAAWNLIHLHHLKAPLLSLQFLEPYSFPKPLVPNLMC